jgi:uncharacterized membrane protein YjgN (DUF898 family)
VEGAPPPDLTSPPEPPPPPEPLPPRPAPREPEPLSFHGTGGEYFRIWIVNLLLSIITLGIYSAWAKVRRLHYFYRNTRLAGASFDFHGRPIAILKGRIAGAILFGGYTAAGAVSPLFGLAAAGVVALLLPWLLVRSLRFRLFNSSYRGLRFHFHGRTSTSYWVFLVLPVLSVFTMFLLVPFVNHRMKKYQYENATFGQTRFSFRAPVGEFYVAYLLAISLLVGVMFLAILAMFLGMIITMAGATTGRPDAPPEMTPRMMLGMLPFFVVYGSGLLALRALFITRLQNEIWSKMRLGDHRFSCRLEGVRLFGILWTNVVLTILTLGLFTPFAQIRLARYMTGRFSVLPIGDLSDFVASERQREVGAYGQEAAEFFDLDIAF